MRIHLIGRMVAGVVMGEGEAGICEEHHAPVRAVTAEEEPCGAVIRKKKALEIVCLRPSITGFLKLTEGSCRLPEHCGKS